ncbi:AGAP000191-PA-like protein [Anopheles sinensis]|uniref:AGAP000191-PA-like protein n=1 Tax=Anopheles sinensis TaxID=74873 RepID=A0A084WPV9_ANOSI|nr:AGAP000191-PA-like protein [Anopheles sinensis]
MGQLSKYFYWVSIDKTCRDMLHPDQNCPRAWCTFFYQGVLGGLRHYLPAVITPLLFRIREWNKPEVWKHFFRQYLCCVLAGLPMTGGSFIAFCIFHHVMGRFPPAWFVLVPSLAGGITVQHLPRHIVRAQGIGLFNMYLEFLIRRARSPLMASLRTSRLYATIVFALLSSCIMAARQFLHVDRFWFARTYPDVAGDSARCHHSEGTATPADVSCRKHITREVLTSFCIGLALSVVKIALPNVKLLVRNPLGLLRLFATRFDLGLLSFITLYKALYEVVSCGLTPYKPIVGPYARSAIGGFMAGLAYCCFPNYLLFTFPITELAELCWLVYIKHDAFPKPRAVRWFDSRVPVSMILYTACLGLLCHLRIVYPYHVNRYWHKLMANGTWGRSEALANGYASILMGYN